MARRRRRWLICTLVLGGLAIAMLLAWVSSEPASAKAGYTCDAGPNHGGPGCHVTVTTKPPAPPTTKRPAPVTTKPPASGTKPTKTPATVAGTSLAATTTSVGPTTTIPGPTTTTTEANGIVAGTSGGGSGTPRGELALVLGLGALALAHWAARIVSGARRRRTSTVMITGSTAPAIGPVRFVLAERLAHWFYALCFLLAGFSGALMWIPSTRAWMADARYKVADYHGYVGIAMVVVPLLTFLILDRKRLAEDRRTLDEWDSNDSRWLAAALAGGSWRGRKMPPQRRFNAAQKVNSHLTAGLAMGFVVTGVLLLLRFRLPYSLAAGVLFAHQVLAVTSGVLLLGHLGMTIFTRHGRGRLGAMVKGTLPAEIAREGHALWYAEWLKQTRREDDRPSVTKSRQEHLLAEVLDGKGA